MNIFRVFLGTAIARNFGVKSPTDLTDGVISAIPKSTAVGAVLVTAIAPNQARAARGIGPGTSQVPAPTPTLTSVVVNGQTLTLTGTNFGNDPNVVEVDFTFVGVNGVAFSATPTAPITPTSMTIILPANILLLLQSAPIAVTVVVNGLQSAPPMQIQQIGIPASLVDIRGTNQRVTVNTQSAQPLSLRVVDSANNSVPNVAVAFVAPPGGASGAPGVNPVNTDANGVVSVAFTANGNAGGPYVVTANVPAQMAVPVASFVLTNVAGPAANINVFAGGQQAVIAGNAFGARFAVRLTDNAGNPVSGVRVVFTPPAVGPGLASGAFANNLNSAETDANGVATAPVFTANNVQGPYNVAANVPNTGLVTNFALVNN